MNIFEPAIRRETFGADLANTLLLRPVYRRKKMFAGFERDSGGAAVIPDEAVEAADRDDE